MAAGYHQHSRGEWRKRREKEKAELSPIETEFWDVIDRAQKGDATTLPKLREFLQLPSLAEQVGNLAKKALELLVLKWCGSNLLAKEGLTLKLEAMRNELAGANPTPLERLLVERIVACWLHLSYLEAVNAGAGSMPLYQSMHYERAITLAQKRHLAAIKTLAQVRKLMGVVIDLPRVGEAPARSATVLPLVRRAANARADDESAGEEPAEQDLDHCNRANAIQPADQRSPGNGAFKPTAQTPAPISPFVQSPGVPIAGGERIHMRPGAFMPPPAGSPGYRRSL